MADVAQVRQIEAMRRLHWAANEVVEAFAGNETATAAQMVASGARRVLLSLHGVEATLVPRASGNPDRPGGS